MRPNYERGRPVSEKKSELRLIVQHLFQMDSRIRTYALGDEIYSVSHTLKCFFIENGHIYIPYALPSAEHEIAHMVEMKNSKRWTMADWGLIGNPSFVDEVKPGLFFAAFAREVRVRAIQQHLTKQEWHPLSQHIAWGGKAIESRLPFGRFKSLMDVELWDMDLHAKTYNAWSTDRIEHEWKIRLNHIQNYMETA